MKKALLHNCQVTEALCYADYYYLEAMVRYRNYRRCVENSITNAKKWDG